MDLLYVLLLLLVITRAAGEIAERLGQPSLAGELLAGVVLGFVVGRAASTFPVLSQLPDSRVFTAITDLAMFFLMLYAGLELRPRELLESSRSAVVVAIGGFLVPLAAGFGLAWVMLPDSGLKVVQALFLGTALAITAVPVAIKILLDLGKLDTRLGRLIVSAALFDDIMSLILLAVLLAMIGTGELPGLLELLLLLGKIAVFFLVATAIGLFVLPRVGYLIGRAKVAEPGMSAVLIGGLGYGYLAELLGLHFIIFLAGLFFNRRIIEGRLYEDVKSKVSGITSGFLAPVFFASIGLHLDVGAVTAVPLFLAVLIAVAFAGKLIGAGVVAYLTGMDRREAAAVGVAMSGRGAVELVIADIALRGGIFEIPDPPPVVENMFSAVVIVAIVTTLATPIALRRMLGASGEQATRAKGGATVNWDQLIDAAGTSIPAPEIAGRLLLAAFFGALIGIEREVRQRPAGLKTHMLTSLAAAVFTVLTFEIFHSVRQLEPQPTVDPIRLIEAVTAGVAFLAAGTIIQGRGRVQGLTTGAAVWMAGSVGVACGAGYYVVALLASVLSLIIFVLVDLVERRVLRTEGKTRSQTE